MYKHNDKYITMKIQELLESEQTQETLPGLNYMQTRQVRSPEFKSWFGDWENGNDASVIRNNHGVPLIMYRGNPQDYGPIFRHDVSQRSTHSGFGFFFTSSTERAGKYATFSSDQGHTQPVFLNIRNLLDLTAYKKLSVEAMTNSGVAISQNTLHQLASHHRDPVRPGEETLHFIFFAAGGKSLQHDITASGYDGLIYPSGRDIFIAAFSPNQVKSAIGNKGTFKQDDDSIVDEEL